MYLVDAHINMMQQLGLQLRNPGTQCWVAHLVRVVHPQQKAQADRRVQTSVLHQPAAAKHKFCTGSKLLSTVTDTLVS